MNDNSSTSELESIDQLAPEEAASLLRSKTQQDIYNTLAGLSDEQQVLLIASHLPGNAIQQEDEHSQLNIDSPATIASLMSETAAVLSLDTTIAGALDYVVKKDPASQITYIFVVDQEQILSGVVVLRDLLLGKPGQTLAEVMTASPFAFSPETSIPEALKAALKKRHRLYPVTGEEGKLLGQVYGWQLYDLVASEISAQVGSLVGVDKEERIGTSIWQAFRMRHPWLQVNLLTAFTAALVVALFEDTITRIVALAAFLPVLAGQSGNTGCQALAITLRGHTMGELADFPIYRLLRKEIVLGALNGFFVGVVAAAAMWIYAGRSGADEPMLLGLVILIAMVGACVGSGIFGVLVPVTLKRFGTDPAMASSIFLTTFTDVLGMGLMLLLATNLLL